MVIRNNGSGAEASSPLRCVSAGGLARHPIKKTPKIDWSSVFLLLQNLRLEKGRLKMFRQLTAHNNINY